MQFKQRLCWPPGVSALDVSVVPRGSKCIVYKNKEKYYEAIYECI